MSKESSNRELPRTRWARLLVPLKLLNVNRNGNGIILLQRNTLSLSSIVPDQ